MRTFFLTRLFREKIALVILVAIAAVLWLSSVSNRAQAFWRSASMTSTDLRVQRQWLADEARIRAEAKAAVEHLDPSRTYDSVRLGAELDTIARAVGISARETAIDDTQVSQGPQFSINSVRFVIRNADWQKQILPFYQELSKRAPYIGIEEFTLLSNRANPAQLTASLRVSSVEITR